jgi:dTDP-4-dehydrorhamnose reductase
LTYIGDLLRAMQILMEAKACGIFHISSIETFTRLELAIRVARFFNLDLRHIVPCLIDDFDFSEPRPKYNSLDTTKIIGMYEFEFTNLHDCLSLIKMNDLNTHPIKQAINFK